MSEQPDVTTTTLDYIDSIIVPGDVFAKAANEYWALLCLRDGLRFLYNQVAQCDAEGQRRLNAVGKSSCTVAGNFPALRGIPQGLITCAFHWYAVSACQYVRTIGAIAYLNDNSRPKPTEYARSVIPEVVSFRDKVAAHFAWTTKHQEDNDAERMASRLPPLVFVNDSFHVGSMNVTTRCGGKRTTSDAIQPWSISEVHRRLCARYWPEFRQPSNENVHGQG